MRPFPPHFTLAEMTSTLHRGIDNTPPAEVLEALRLTAWAMEALRNSVLGGNPCTVSSGYRCPKLNHRVGGSKTSAHMAGRAVDFNVYRLGSPLDVCRAIAASGAAFDQLIEEGTWVHIAFGGEQRRQILTKGPKGGYITGLRAE